jgi:CTP synthase (UTP-ammonia lyase)
MIRIALIGDYNEAVIAHRAISLALTAAAQNIGVEVHADWVHTSAIGDAKQLLETYGGVWCVPASPYVNANGALAAIRYARQSGRPFLGTCGGFQHALLEYAHGVWGIDAPAHAETDPDASDPVIAPLMCSLVNVADALRFVPGSRLAQIYGITSTTEEYQCSYGLSPRYEARLQEGPLRIAARDSEGSVRGVELDGHPFFIATLFQPERAALQGRIPPLALAFVKAAASRQKLFLESVP